MNEALSKLTRISRLGALFAKGMMVIIVLGTVVAVAILIAVYIDPNIVADITAPADIYNVPVEDIDMAALAKVLSVGMLVLGIVGFRMMYYIYQLFDNIHKNNTPFTDDNAKYLQRIAVLMIVSTIILPIIDGVMQRVVNVEYYSQLGFGGFPILVALLLFFLSLVFKYGATLQKESDETL